MAMEAGQFELNAFEPVVFESLFQSIKMLDHASVTFRENCIEGITANVEQVEWTTWLDQVYAKREYETTIVGFDASILSATAMLARWESSNPSNMINYSNVEYDELFTKALASYDDAEQTELYKECLRILNKTAANVYIQDLVEFVAIHPDLAGYEFYPLYVMDLATIHWNP